MSDSIHDLLEIEKQAEQIVQDAEKQRQQIRQQALDDANANIEQFNARLPELHQSFLDKANERAEQSIAELKLRYNEHNSDLRKLAEEHEQEALDAAIKVFFDPQH